MAPHELRLTMTIHRVSMLLFILLQFTLTYSFEWHDSPPPRKEKEEPKLFAAVEHMKPLVQIERRLLEIAKNYLKEQRKKLGELAPFAKSVEEAMKMSETDPEKYLGNPINCYLIIKRFTSGWKELRSRLDMDESSLRG